MAVLLNLASTAYGVGPVGPFPVTVSANVVTLLAQLSRPLGAWPGGVVATVNISWSDGTGCQVSLEGGDLTRHGSPVLTSDLLVSKRLGVTQGTVSVNVLQALTTAVTVTSA